MFIRPKLQTTIVKKRRQRAGKWTSERGLAISLDHESRVTTCTIVHIVLKTEPM
jgi:hypothetical protein